MKKFISIQEILIVLVLAVPCSAAFIGLDPNDFYFSAGEGGLDPDDQVLSIWNDGSDILYWRITEDCDWLTVTPDSGNSSGETNAAVISVDPSGLSVGQYQCGLTVSDPNAINNPQTVTLNLTFSDECVKSDAPFYNEWVGVGKAWDRPDCWCYPRQCRGDADGLKPGMFWVETADLGILIDCFNIGDKNLTGNRICGDFDHLRSGMFRVETSDLNILLEYFNIGDKNIPFCPLDWDGDFDDDYNFWISP